MQFGMPTLIENESLIDNASLCRKLGLNFVELNMNLPQYQVEKLEDIQYLLDVANKYNIYYTIHLDENLNVCDFNEAVAHAYLDTVRRTIQIAKKLHIPLLNMHMNEGVHFTLPDKKVYLFEQYKDTYLQKIINFRDMCKKCIFEDNTHGTGKDNIVISIENTGAYFPFQQEAIELLLESDVFSLTWDIGHSHASGNLEEAFIMGHEDRLKHFHIHDAINKKNHLTLGAGEINLQERLNIADRNNCRCVVETKTIESLKQSVLWLNDNWRM